jgi:hypothetical protein
MDPARFISLGLTVGTWLLLTVSSWTLLQAYLTRITMILMYGRSRYDTCCRLTWLLGLQSRRIVQLGVWKWGLFLLGICGMVRHFEASEHPFLSFDKAFLFALALTVGVIQFWGQGRPAAVLLLGASRSTALMLHRRLSNITAPHRTVSLLERADDPTTIHYTAGDCFRVNWGSWQSTIRRLIRNVVLIVIDARSITDAVRHELREIVELEVQYKTILLVNAKSDVHDEKLLQCRIEDSEDACLRLVGAILSAPDKLPSDSKPIAAS